MVEMVVNFLIKVAFMSLDPLRDTSTQQLNSNSSSSLAPRCQQLVNDALSIWPVQHYHDLGMFFKSCLPNSNETLRMLNRQRELTLSHPTVAPTATSSTYI